MPRRRNSPMPDRLPDTPDTSDDNLSHPSDDELFLEQEDPQSSFREGRSRWASFWSMFSRDPHAPKSIPLSDRRSRRRQRREKRAARRGRRRGRKAESESSIMYEADSAAGSYRDDDNRSSFDWSDDELREKGVARPRKKGRLGFGKICMFFLLTCVSIILILFGVLRIQKDDHNKGLMNKPTGKPPKYFNNGTSNFGPTTILVSLDGFRADYLDRGITPALSAFISKGVSPKYMLPSFPSVTFPNHWTLVTGLHPESHGVVGNSFWDETLGEEFFYTDPLRSMSPKWWDSTGAEPLWAVAEKQGVRTAVHMWPGSEAGLLPSPTYLDKYNGKEKLSRKVESVLAWLDLPSPFDSPDGAVNTQLSSPRPQFITMYVPDVDRDGHNFGPNSTEILKTITAVDNMIADLISGLEARNLSDIVNVVVVSDHGMATTSRDRLVQFEDLLDPQDIAHIDGWPLYGLRPKAGVDVEKLYSSLRSKLVASGDNPGWSVYTVDRMPDRWHFKANPRIAPLFLVPDAGWSIVTKDELDLSDPANADAVYHPRGIHGYDNQHPLMRAIFAARGPAFPHPPGSRLKPFQNIEVYNIVCYSLGVVPNPSNGTLSFPLSTQGIHGDGGQDDMHDEIPGQPAEDIPGEAGDGISKPEEKPDEDVPDEDRPETGELSKIKGKLKDIYDSIKDGVGKIKGWLSDTFGAKKTSGESS